LKRTLSLLAFTSLSVALAPLARAQFGGQPGGMPPGGGMGQPPMGEDTKAEGPAEEAPEEEEKPTEIEPVGGYASQARRVRKVVEIDGYLRLRSDFFHQFDLGQAYSGNPGAPDGPPPFPIPLECGLTTTECESKNLGTGNLRLRVEPTINVTDQVRVMAQIDVFDNLILGSTPDSLINYRRPGDLSSRAPLGALSNTQVPPEVGQNGIVSSIRAKRAWGEVDSEFGSLRFGRMPWHFGRGIAFNNGNCSDCDGGTSVDRIMALTTVYGHQLALAWDFGAQGYTAGMIDLGYRDPNGYPLDLSQRDDVLELMAAITHIEDERAFQERAAQGELMFNYGAQLVYRQQGQATNQLAASPTVIGVTNTNGTTPGMDKPSQNPAATNPSGPSPITSSDLASPGQGTLTTDVDATVIIPSLWMKLAWKALTIEAETTGIFGKINNAGLLSADPAPHLTLRQLGWVVASELRLYKNAFTIGFETGGATGDQAENPRAYLNYNWKFVQQPAGDHKLTDFKFNPDYHVDEILFRHILGTVSNAVYVKPAMSYWLDLAERRQIGLNAAVIYSGALVPVSTPGNAISYGVEMNVGANYRNPADGFYAGITWGVLWPMSALDRPNTTSSTGTLWPNAQPTSAAQSLRTFLGIKF
jgi:hypothetical protein